MKVVSVEKINLIDFGITSDCEVYAAHIKVDDVGKRAEEMIETISDTSWIKKLNVLEQVAFKATSKRTIVKLVQNVTNRLVDDKLTEDFGEYMISDTAQCVLEEQFDHTKVPLAELIKARLTGNEGFDFHTVCKESVITFGEAKYSGNINPYQNALKQIVSFIELNKDEAELVVLLYHISSEAANNFAEGRKAYAAAFSVNAKSPKLVINNAIQSEHLSKLLNHKALYLIGVEVDDPELP